MRKPITKKLRKRLFSRQPTNYIFWYFVLHNKKDIKDFLERGSDRQIALMIRTLKYMKQYRKSRFEEMNGKEILEKLKTKRGR